MKEEVNWVDLREALLHGAPEGKTKIGFKEFVKFQCRKTMIDFINTFALIFLWMNKRMNLFAIHKFIDWFLV